jgi:hypothetical protein
LKNDHRFSFPRQSRETAKAAGNPISDSLPPCGVQYLVLTGGFFSLLVHQFSKVGLCLSDFSFPLE